MSDQLMLYDTLRGEKRPFVPHIAGKVSMYVCGMTVYDRCHLGHARVMVFFDVVARYFEQQGYQVNHVRNITDIDDKIIFKAQQSKQSWTDLIEYYIEALRQDEQALGIVPPTHQPRATKYLDEMINIIDSLVKKGAAYLGENGDVYYAVDQFPGYGQLSKQDIKQLRQGERVVADGHKRNDHDFALWKHAVEGEPSWPAPWGAGRPGWHIECSAMSLALLGETIDIHGGGLDLQFPHHENEIAQSEVYCGHEVVRYWMHAGHLQIDREKMSKSLGNFSTIQDMLKEHHPEVLRYFLLSSHYRSPLDYSVGKLAQAYEALQRGYVALGHYDDCEVLSAWPDGAVFGQKFISAMNDDFNTPNALAVIFDAVRELNRSHDAGQSSQAVSLACEIKAMGQLLGLFQSSSAAFLRQGITDDLDAMVQVKIAARNDARREHRWQDADHIRDELAKQGIVLEDMPSGTTWKKTHTIR